MKSDGTIDKYKARLVIKGYRQREGLDTYLLVMRITSIRMVLAIVAIRNLEVHQMDVKTAFLNGDLEEEIYMEQPEGFNALGQEGKLSRYPTVIEGYSDANWISDIKDSRSTSGYVFTLGVGAISWKSSKQTVISRSIMGSEFIA
ncbi:DNA polymerase zeta catalytic subunit-like protein [Tanacetum coccineum]